MSAAVCSGCVIAFPYTHTRCQVCDERLTTVLTRDPDADWKERVNRLLTRGHANLEVDVESWRLHELLRLGVVREEAEHLAGRPDVDVGKLRTLVCRGCPVETAVRIVA